MALFALDDRITLKYGAGGHAMRSLIQQVFVDGMAHVSREGDVGLAAMDDGAAIRIGEWVATISWWWAASQASSSV